MCLDVECIMVWMVVCLFTVQRVMRQERLERQRCRDNKQKKMQQRARPDLRRQSLWPAVRPHHWVVIVHTISMGRAVMAMAWWAQSGAIKQNKHKIAKTVGGAMVSWRIKSAQARND